ncbi:MAG TPA: sigma-70 family RNA polymerase sigma factor [Candidatus Angelobacter sp.]|nr:sigma-70 family RNA polymerase sigma factor [Candidatus Angelobacter sp.]
MKIDTIRIDMNFASKPAEAVLPAVRELFEKSGAVRFGLTIECFEAILEQVAAKYSPQANSQQKQQLWRELRIEELVLARACSAGNELAWVEFLTKYREKLYDIARGVAKEDSNARDLADSLYADLYGTTEKEGRRVSRLNFYMGRGSLEGWLRTVIAQEFVNRYRKTKRLVSLEEETEEGVQFSSANSIPVQIADHRLGEATDEALDQLAAEERLVLAAYYLDNRTLTEIGKIVGVHESTISRRLEKLLKTLRKQVMLGLQTRGMNRGQAEEALEADVRYLAVDVRRRLQENRSAAFQEDNGSD